MIRRLLLATALAVLAGASAAAPLPPADLTPLVVIAPPKDAPPAEATIAVGSDETAIGGQAVAIWPAGALAAGASGWVTLNCLVDIHGLAETCRVLYESPRGKGFGAAALALRPTLKLQPKTGPDGPVDARMNIAVAFRPPNRQNNLQQIMLRNAAPAAAMTEDGAGSYGDGHHEANLRGLFVYGIPQETRRITLMSAPAWSRAPTFDQLAAAYPEKGAGVEGYAVAHCRVEKTGALKTCAVVRELPTGHGFGKAAMALVPSFQASAEVMALAPRGAPVEVDVPIRFPPPTEAKDHTVRAPVWISGADPDSLIRDFPVALARPKSPGAVVQCTVGADGGLTGCEIELTSPDGIDFDEAAVRLASRLKMNLWSAEAGPVQGGVVHLPVRLGPTEQAQK